MLFYHSGNRDETAFADPWRFDVAREPNHHLGFGGGGPHYCLGASLARSQLRSLFARAAAARSPTSRPASRRCSARARSSTGSSGWTCSFTPRAERSAGYSIGMSWTSARLRAPALEALEVPVDQRPERQQHLAQRLGQPRCSTSGGISSRSAWTRLIERLELAARALVGSGLPRQPAPATRPAGARRRRRRSRGLGDQPLGRVGRLARAAARAGAAPRARSSVIADVGRSSSLERHLERAVLEPRAGRLEAGQRAAGA